VCASKVVLSLAPLLLFSNKKLNLFLIVQRQTTIFSKIMGAVRDTKHHHKSELSLNHEEEDGRSRAQSISHGSLMR
jgi:fatty acid-binding protein DegV